MLLWHWGRRGAGPRYTLDLAKALRALPNIETHVSIATSSELYTETVAVSEGSFCIDTYTNLWSALLASVRLPLLRYQFANYLKAAQIDVVLCTMTHIWNRFFFDVLTNAHIPLVTVLHDASLHAGEDSKLGRLLLNQEVRQASHIITLSDYVRSHVVTASAAPVHVIPHAVYDYLGTTSCPREMPHGRPLRLLFFGRILAYKGLDLLLEAYALLRGQNKLELQIAGAGDMTLYREALEQLPEIRVTNTWLADQAVGQYLAWADVVVVPYREASQSGVIAAAYGAGLPVIVTPVGGLTEQVRPGKSGLIASDVSATAIAACIQAFLDDSTLYGQCSAGACWLAQQDLSWIEVAQQTVAILREALTTSGRS